MTPLLWIAPCALAVAASCARPVPASSADVDARLRKVEQTLARREAALAFLDQVYEQQRLSAEAAEADEPAPDAIFAVDIARDVQLGMVDGPATAAVTIVEAFDFVCPHCARTSPILDELVREYAGRLRVVYKNLIIHGDRARPAHLASCAAARQGKYLAFKNAFWDKGFGAYLASRGADESSLSADHAVKIAGDLQIDVSRFKVDMAGVECERLIAGDQADLDPFKVTGTPTFFINGTLVSGGMPKDDFKRMIDEKLAIVAASGVPAGEYYQREVQGKGEKKFRSKKDPRP